RSLKRIKFSEDTKDNPTYETLSFSKPKASSARRQWINRFRNEEFEQLKKDLQIWNQKGLTVENIFETEGQAILDWAIRTSSTVRPLSFILENASREAIKKSISADNCFILNMFLLTEIGLDGINQTSQERLNNRREKIKLLLEIDSDDIRTFMESS